MAAARGQRELCHPSTTVVRVVLVATALEPVEGALMRRSLEERFSPWWRAWGTHGLAEPRTR